MRDLGSKKGLDRGFCQSLFVMGEWKIPQIGCQRHQASDGSHTSFSHSSTGVASVIEFRIVRSKS